MEEAVETGKVVINDVSGNNNDFTSNGAGSIDHAVTIEQEGFKCHRCGKFHNSPYGSKAGPMRHWCSKECFEDERN